MNNESSYKIKAHKYKMKYLGLKNITQNGGGQLSHHVMDIIELYRKTLNLYVLYRFRYDNTNPLIDLDKIGNLVFKFESMTQSEYNKYYISDLLDQKNIKELLESEEGIERILFTLRQDSTKIIRNILLINIESDLKINKFIKFILKNKLNDPSTFPSKPTYANEFSEIHSKCDQLLSLVKSNKHEFVKTNETNDLDGLRNKTNLILNILGNDYDRYVKVKKGDKNFITDEANTELEQLFNLCFHEITIKLSEIIN
jgi:hypothetical protein